MEGNHASQFRTNNSYLPSAKGAYRKVKKLTDNEEPIFVMRNNSLAAVIISPAEYELLKDADEVLEHLEIADMIQKRLKTYDRSRNIAWDKVKAEHGL